MVAHSTPRPPPLSFEETTPLSITTEFHRVKDEFDQSLEFIKDGKGKGTSKAKDAIAAFSLALGEASAASARLTLPSMVHEHADVRRQSNQVKDDLALMFSKALSDGEIFAIMQAAASSAPPDVGKVAEHILSIMLQNGAGCENDQSTDDHDELTTLRAEIERQCTAFCECINENADFLLFSDVELSGVDDLDRYPLDETTKKRRVTLKAPDTLPILKSATDSATRRVVLQAMSTKCQDENTRRFERVLELRQQSVDMMKLYKCHAEHELATKMAGTDVALRFLSEMVEAYQPKLEHETKLLVQLKRLELGLSSDDKEEVSLDAWDLAFYTSQFKAQFAGVDEAVLRQYFPLEHVKATIFSIYEELLLVKFEREKAQVWHEDVECYSVFDSTSKELQGQSKASRPQVSKDLKIFLLCARMVLSRPIPAQREVFSSMCVPLESEFRTRRRITCPAFMCKSWKPLATEGREAFAAHVARSPDLFSRIRTYHALRSCKYQALD